MNNESILNQHRKETISKNRKIKTAAAAALLSGALFALPSVANADSWKANTPSEVAANIANTTTPYTIRSGDTLWAISEALKTKNLDVSPEQLAKMNGIDNADLIYTGNTLKFNGQKIVIPTPDPKTNQVDKTALSAKLQEANKYIYTQGIYTEASLNNLREAAMRGNGVIKSDMVSQQDVTNAIWRITQAINNLVRVQAPAPTVNKQPLEAKIQEANKYIYTQGVYTEGSLNNLREAAMRGNGVIKSDMVSQQDVTVSINRIDQAIGALQKLPSQTVNKQPLAAKLQEANKYIYTQGVYTEGSLNNLREAAMRGNGVIKSDLGSQQDVTRAINRIDQAIGALEKLPSQTVNKQPLAAKLQEANKYLHTQGVYTEASLNNLNEAAIRGNGVIKSDLGSQQDVTNAINRIDQAIGALEKQ